MRVKRIVANIAAAVPESIAAFYRDLLDLEMIMDQGWILTLASGEMATTQLSVVSEGGSGTQAPDLSIEVDDLEAVLERANHMCLTIEYGPILEPWGVRRFYVRDPSGKLLNILVHDV